MSNYISDNFFSFEYLQSYLDGIDREGDRDPTPQLHHAFTLQKSPIGVEGLDSDEEGEDDDDESGEGKKVSGEGADSDQEGEGSEDYGSGEVGCFFFQISHFKVEIYDLILKAKWTRNERLYQLNYMNEKNKLSNN